MYKRQSEKTIKGEFSKNGVENSLSHTKGVVSMARSEDYDSASSQFFICVSDDATYLDGEYAAFGKVLAGYEMCIRDRDYATWTFEGNYSNYNATDYTRTKCNLYFVKTKTVSTVLGNLEVYTYTPDFTKSACDDAAC